MDTKKYKVLLLSDLKEDFTSTLESAVSMANMVNGELKVFHAKKAIDVVGKDNQLSANRAINQAINTTDTKLKSLVQPVAKKLDIKIDYNFSFGNVKDQIISHIKDYNPDIIVLGQRKFKLLSLNSDKLINFVLKKYQGALVLVSPESEIKPNKKLSVGIFNDTKETLDLKCVDAIFKNTAQTFSISEAKKNQTTDITEAVEGVNQYIFEKKSDAYSNISSYITKNNIDLLCLNRKQSNQKSEFKNLINKVNVSLLVSDKKTFNK